MVLWRSSLIAKITKRPSMAVCAGAIVPDREDHEAAIHGRTVGECGYFFSGAAAAGAFFLTFLVCLNMADSCFPGLLAVDW